MPELHEVPYEIVVRGIDSKTVSVEGFANFLRDLVFLHDRLWIIISGRELNYDLSSGYFYTRKGRPLPDNQKLQLIFVKQGSPFEVGIVIHSAPFVASTAWIFVQILRALVLLPGEKKKQGLEIEELETKKAQRQNQATGAARDVSERLAQEIGSRPGDRETEMQLLNRDIKRISAGNLFITEVEVRRNIKTNKK